MSTRRQFLKQSALVSLSPWIPAFLSRSMAAENAKPDDRILVVLQLDGGNDGLNTVIPYADENYEKNRKELRIAKKDILKLNDAIGLHPAMKPAAKLFEEHRLSVIQGVGYPNANRSHFESMAIWHHARLDARDHDSIGWLGRAIDTAPNTESSLPQLIQVGSEALAVAVRGRRCVAAALSDEAEMKLLNPIQSAAKPAPDAEDVQAFVTRTVDQSFAAANEFANSDAKQSPSGATYPNSALASKFQLISRLIKLDGGTRVYYVSQSGYDTHSAQLYTHQRLLYEMAQAVKAFQDDLRASNLEDRVALVAFSEFGRRVQENGSAGTDHGVAGPILIAGTKLRTGIVGEHPSLTDLDEGDLKMAIDFRQVYAAVLKDWLSIDPAPILGAQPPLDLFTMG
jgi:uncharacterized protein (DUF1501 family)